MGRGGSWGGGGGKDRDGGGLDPVFEGLHHG